MELEELSSENLFANRVLYTCTFATVSGAAELAVENRVGRAWGKFNTMATLLCNKRVSGG